MKMITAGFAVVNGKAVSRSTIAATRAPNAGLTTLVLTPSRGWLSRNRPTAAEDEAHLLLAEALLRNVHAARRDQSHISALATLADGAA